MQNQCEINDDDVHGATWDIDIKLLKCILLNRLALTLSGTELIGRAVPPLHMLAEDLPP